MPWEEVVTRRWVAPLGLAEPTRYDLNGRMVAGEARLRARPFFMHETCAPDAGDSWANFSQENFDNTDFINGYFDQRIIQVGTLVGTSRVVHAQLAQSESTSHESVVRLTATPFINLNLGNIAFVERKKSANRSQNTAQTSPITQRFQRES